MKLKKAANVDPGYKRGQKVHGAVDGIVTGLKGDSRDGGKRQHGANTISTYDIAAPRGTPVKWDRDEEGEVVFAGRRGGYGNVVETRVGDKLNRKAHLDTINVKVGDRVSRGTVVGGVGHTGKTRGKTGDHLHDEWRNYTPPKAGAPKKDSALPPEKPYDALSVFITQRKTGLANPPPMSGLPEAGSSEPLSPESLDYKQRVERQGSASVMSGNAGRRQIGPKRDEISETMLGVRNAYPRGLAEQGLDIPFMKDVPAPAGRRKAVAPVGPASSRGIAPPPTGATAPSPEPKVGRALPDPRQMSPDFADSNAPITPIAPPGAAPSTDPRAMSADFSDGGAKPSAPGQPQPGPGGVFAAQRIGEAPIPVPIMPGNIDLTNRPVVQNEDGTISTVRSMSINQDGKEILIPTVIDGKVVSDEEAIDAFHRTGEHLGVFATVEDANAYAEKLHQEQEAMYAPPTPDPRAMQADFGPGGPAAVPNLPMPNVDPRDQRAMRDDPGYARPGSIEDVTGGQPLDQPDANGLVPFHNGRASGVEYSDVTQGDVGLQRQRHPMQIGGAGQVTGSTGIGSDGLPSLGIENGQEIRSTGTDMLAPLETQSIYVADAGNGSKYVRIPIPADHRLVTTDSIARFAAENLGVVTDPNEWDKLREAGTPPIVPTFPAADGSHVPIGTDAELQKAVAQARANQQKNSVDLAVLQSANERDALDAKDTERYDKLLEWSEKYGRDGWVDIGGMRVSILDAGGNFRMLLSEKDLNRARQVAGNPGEMPSAPDPYAALPYQPLTQTEKAFNPIAENIHQIGSHPLRAGIVPGSSMVNAGMEGIGRDIAEEEARTGKTREELYPILDSNKTRTLFNIGAGFVHNLSLHTINAPYMEPLASRPYAILAGKAGKFGETLGDLPWFFLPVGEGVALAANGSKLAGWMMKAGMAEEKVAAILANPLGREMATSALMLGGLEAVKGIEPGSWETLPDRVAEYGGRVGVQGLTGAFFPVVSKMLPARLSESQRSTLAYAIMANVVPRVLGGAPERLPIFDDPELNEIAGWGVNLLEGYVLHKGMTALRGRNNPDLTDIGIKKMGKHGRLFSTTDADGIRSYGTYDPHTGKFTEISEKTWRKYGMPEPDLALDADGFRAIYPHGEMGVRTDQTRQARKRIEDIFQGRNPTTESALAASEKVDFLPTDTIKGGTYNADPGRWLNPAEQGKLPPRSDGAGEYQAPEFSANENTAFQAWASRKKFNIERASPMEVAEARLEFLAGYAPEKLTDSDRSYMADMWRERFAHRPGETRQKRLKGLDDDKTAADSSRPFDPNIFGGSEQGAFDAWARKRNIDPSNLSELQYAEQRLRFTAEYAPERLSESDKNYLRRLNRKEGENTLAAQNKPRTAAQDALERDPLSAFIAARPKEAKPAQEETAAPVEPPRYGLIKQDPKRAAEADAKLAAERRANVLEAETRHRRAVAERELAEATLKAIDEAPPLRSEDLERKTELEAERKQISSAEGALGDKERIRLQEIEVETNLIDERLAGHGELLEYERNNRTRATKKELMERKPGIEESLPRLRQQESDALASLEALKKQYAESDQAIAEAKRAGQAKQPAVTPTVDSSKPLTPAADRAAVTKKLADNAVKARIAELDTEIAERTEAIAQQGGKNARIDLRRILEKKIAQRAKLAAQLEQPATTQVPAEEQTQPDTTRITSVTEAEGTSAPDSVPPISRRKFQVDTDVPAYLTRFHPDSTSDFKKMRGKQVKAIGQAVARSEWRQASSFAGASQTVINETLKNLEAMGLAQKAWDKNGEVYWASADKPLHGSLTQDENAFGEKGDQAPTAPEPEAPSDVLPSQPKADLRTREGRATHEAAFVGLTDQLQIGDVYEATDGTRYEVLSEDEFGRLGPVVKKLKDGTIRVPGDELWGARRVSRGKKAAAPAAKSEPFTEHPLPTAGHTRPVMGKMSRLVEVDRTEDTDTELWQPTDGEGGFVRMAAANIETDNEFMVRSFPTMEKARAAYEDAVGKVQGGKSGPKAKPVLAPAASEGRETLESLKPLASLKAKDVTGPEWARAHQHFAQMDLWSIAELVKSDSGDYGTMNYERGKEILASLEKRGATVKSKVVKEVGQEIFTITTPTAWGNRVENITWHQKAEKWSAVNVVKMQSATSEYWPMPDALKPKRAEAKPEPVAEPVSKAEPVNVEVLALAKAIARDNDLTTTTADLADRLVPILEELDNNGEMSIGALYEAFGKSNAFSAATIQTWLDRGISSGHIEFEVEDGEKQYALTDEAREILEPGDAPEEMAPAPAPKPVPRPAPPSNLNPVLAPHVIEPKAPVSDKQAAENAIAEAAEKMRSGKVGKVDVADAVARLKARLAGGGLKSVIDDGETDRPRVNAPADVQDFVNEMAKPSILDNFDILLEIAVGTVQEGSTKLSDWTTSFLNTISDNFGQEYADEFWPYVPMLYRNARAIVDASEAQNGPILDSADGDVEGRVPGTVQEPGTEGDAEQSDVETGTDSGADDGRDVEADDVERDADGISDVGGQGSSGEADARVDSADGEETGSVESPTTAIRPIRAGSMFRAHETDISDWLQKSSRAQKFAANLAAIDKARELTSIDRAPTAEEQLILAKWTGWGQFKEYFTKENEEGAGKLARDIAELKKRITPEEFASLRASFANAHYTDPRVIEAMWNYLRRAGFQGGRILEPAVGSGNFLGWMPDDILSTSTIVSVELEQITAQIAHLLYPQANVWNNGYQDVNIKPNTFDLVISNVPFGEYTVYDKETATFFAEPKQMMIHNYYFARSLNVVKPGGLIAFITSTGTMDAKTGNRFRERIGTHAEFIGSVRLPGDAFLKNAGTGVTTDIIFLRKKGGKNAKPIKGAEDWLAGTEQLWTPPNVPSWQSYGKFHGNSYYSKHPTHVLGDWAASTLYGSEDRLGVVSREGQNTLKLLNGAFKGFPADVFAAEASKPAEKPIVEGKASKELQIARIGRYTVQNDKNGKPVIYMESENGPIVATVAKAAEPRIRDFIGVRDALEHVFETQKNREMDTVKDLARANLQKAYDAFVKKHGRLLESKNKRSLAGDPSLALVTALESYDQDKNIVADAAVFTKDVIYYYEPPTSADSAEDAVRISMLEFEGINMARVAELLGISKMLVRHRLLEEGVAFEDPDTGTIEPPEEYLSGQIGDKLRAAEKKAKIDRSFERNVEALKAVMPPPKTREVVASQTRLGATFVDSDIIEDFARSVLGVDIDIKVDPVTASWGVDLRSTRDASLRNAKWGVKGKAPAEWILLKALNGQRPTVQYRDMDGKTVTDVNATNRAEAKMADMQRRFEKYLNEEQHHGDRVAVNFNRRYNEYRRRTFPTTPIQVLGVSPDVLAMMRPYQNSAARQIGAGYNMLAAHEPGAGKTLTSAVGMGIMLARGIAKKIAFGALPSTVSQIEREIRRALPSANILVANRKNMDTKKRAAFLGAVATSAPDIVIAAHSSLGLIPLRPESYKVLFKENVTMMLDAIVALGDDISGTVSNVLRQVNSDFIKDVFDEIIEERGYDFTAQKKAKRSSGGRGANQSTKLIERQLKKMIEQMKKKLDKVQERAKKKDTTVYWEDLGFDAMVVDESHNFKSLPYASSMGRIAGMGGDQNSDKAEDMYVKIRDVNKKRGGDRGVSFLTGTPVTNTLGELYTIMRYLSPSVLKDVGAESFDAWSATFARVGQKLEPVIGGEFRLVNRFRRFVNGIQLMTLVSTFTDIQTADMLQLPKPRMKTGKPIPNRIPMQAWTYEYSRHLLTRISDMKSNSNRGKKGEDCMPAITGDGRLATLDIRLTTNRNFGLAEFQDPTTLAAIAKARADYDPTGKVGWARHPLHAGSKAEAVGANMHRIFLEGAEQKTTQLMFADFGLPDKKNPEAFNFYDALRDDLISRGVPASQIVYFRDYKTPEQQQELFDKFNAGDIRILFGNTSSLGTGTNVQRRVAAVHFATVPYRPTDLEQATARAIRQGNLHIEWDKEVEVHHYIMEGKEEIASMDAWAWNLIARKLEFVNQFWKGLIDELEDLSEDDYTEDEYVAMAMNNPLMTEKVALGREYQRLQTDRQNWQEEQRDIKSQIAQAHGQIKAHEAESAKFAADQPEAQKIQIEGNPLSEKYPFMVAGSDGPLTVKQAVAALAPQEDQFLQEHSGALPIARVGKFRLSIQTRKSIAMVDGKLVNAISYFFTIEGPNGTFKRTPDYLSESATFATGLNNGLMYVSKFLDEVAAGTVVEENAAQVAKSTREIKGLEDQIVDLFPEEAELERVSNRLAEINHLLGKNKSDAAADDGNTAAAVYLALDGAYPSKPDRADRARAIRLYTEAEPDGWSDNEIAEHIVTQLGIEYDPIAKAAALAWINGDPVPKMAPAPKPAAPEQEDDGFRLEPKARRSRVNPEATQEKAVARLEKLRERLGAEASESFDYEIRREAVNDKFEIPVDATLVDKTKEVAKLLAEKLGDTSREAVEYVEDWLNGDDDRHTYEEYLDDIDYTGIFTEDNATEVVAKLDEITKSTDSSERKTALAKELRMPASTSTPTLVTMAMEQFEAGTFEDPTRMMVEDWLAGHDLNVDDYTDIDDEPTALKSIVRFNADGEEMPAQEGRSTDVEKILKSWTEVDTSVGDDENKRETKIEYANIVSSMTNLYESSPEERFERRKALIKNWKQGDLAVTIGDGIAYRPPLEDWEGPTLFLDSTIAPIFMDLFEAGEIEPGLGGISFDLHNSALFRPKKWAIVKRVFDSKPGGPLGDIVGALVLARNDAMYAGGTVNLVFIEQKMGDVVRTATHGRVDQAYRHEQSHALQRYLAGVFNPSDRYRMKYIPEEYIDSIPGIDKVLDRLMAPGKGYESYSREAMAMEVFTHLLTSNDVAYLGLTQFEAMQMLRHFYDAVHARYGDEGIEKFMIYATPAAREANREESKAIQEARAGNRENDRKRELARKGVSAGERWGKGSILKGVQKPREEPDTGADESTALASWIGSAKPPVLQKDAKMDEIRDVQEKEAHPTSMQRIKRALEKAATPKDYGTYLLNLGAQTDSLVAKSSAQNGIMPPSQNPTAINNIAFGGAAGMVEAALLDYGDIWKKAGKAGLEEPLIRMLNYKAYKRAYVTKREHVADQMLAFAEYAVDHMPAKVWDSLAKAGVISDTESRYIQGVASSRAKTVSTPSMNTPVPTHYVNLVWNHISQKMWESAARYKMSPKGYVDFMARRANDRHDVATTKERMRTGKIVPRGIREKQIPGKIARIERSLTPEQLAKLNELQAALFEINRQMWDLAHSVGIISTKVYNRTVARGDEYVPLSRIMDSLGSGKTRNKYHKEGLDLAQQDILHKLEGSEKDNVHPILASMARAAETIREAARNHAARTFINLRHRDPLLASVIVRLKDGEKPGEGMAALNVFIDGKKTQWQVPDFVEWEMGLATAQQVELIGGTFIQWWNHLFKAGATGMNLAFALPNLARDLRDWTRFAEHAPRLHRPDQVATAMVQWGMSFYQVLAKSGAYRDWLRAGGAFATLQKQLTPNAFLNGMLYSAMQRPWTVLAAPYIAVGKFVNAIEESTKLTAYKRALSGNRRDGMSEEDSVVAAIYESRAFGGSPDFAIGGSFGGQVNMFYPFFRAALAGIRRNVRWGVGRDMYLPGGRGGIGNTGGTPPRTPKHTIANIFGGGAGRGGGGGGAGIWAPIIGEPDGAKNTTITNSRRHIAALMRLAMHAFTMFMIALLYYEYHLSQYEDDYEDVLRSDRDKNWIIFKAETAVDAKGKTYRPYDKVPMSHFDQVFFPMMLDILRWSKGKDVELSGTVGREIEMFSPLTVNTKPNESIVRSVSRAALSNLSPVFREPIEQGMNWDSFRDIPIEAPWMEKLDPTLRYNARTTSPTAVSMAKYADSLIRKFSGGPVDMWINSPVRIQRFINSITGGASELPLGIIDAFDDTRPPAETPEDRLRTMPVIGPLVRRFIGSSRSQRELDATERFYGNYKNTDKAINSFHHEGEEFGAEAAEAYIANPQNFIRAAFAKELDDMVSSQSELRKGYNTIATSNVDDEVKQFQLRKLNDQEAALLKRAEQINKIIESGDMEIAAKDPAVQLFRYNAEVELHKFRLLEQLKTSPAFRGIGDPLAQRKVYNKLKDKVDRMRLAPADPMKDEQKQKKALTRDVEDFDLLRKGKVRDGDEERNLWDWAFEEK